METIQAVVSSPPPWAGRIRHGLMSISTEETRPARRGFRVDSPAMAERLGRVGATFLAGYHAALLDTQADSLAATLNATVEPGWRGFAFEGAGFGLALLDVLTPWKRDRYEEFVTGPARHHVYLLWVGYGWTFARTPRRLEPTVAQVPSIYRWLTLDGYGFHHGFFSWPQAVTRQRVPRRLRGYAPRAFDHGLGRSLWFVEGADPERIATTIGRFAAHRQGDLWSGVGLACTYAGGLDHAGIERLRGLAGEFAPDLGQGASFAANARLLAQDWAPQLEPACAVLCGTTVEEASDLTDRTLAGLPPDGELPRYEHWRRRVRAEVATALQKEGGL